MLCSCEGDNNLSEFLDRLMYNWHFDMGSALFELAV